MQGYVVWLDRARVPVGASDDIMRRKTEPPIIALMIPAVVRPCFLPEIPAWPPNPRT